MCVNDEATDVFVWSECLSEPYLQIDGPAMMRNTRSEKDGQSNGMASRSRRREKKETRKREIGVTGDLAAKVTR